MRKKLGMFLTVLLLGLASIVCAGAAPALQVLHDVTEPATGITVSLYERGDEYFSYRVDASERIVEPYGGYFWYVRADKGALALSERVTAGAKDVSAIRAEEISGSVRDALTALRNSLPAEGTAKDSIPQIPKGYDVASEPDDAGYGRIVPANTDAVEKPAREDTCPLLVLHIQFDDMPAAFDDAAWHQRIFEDGVAPYYSAVSEGAFTYTPMQETSGTKNDGVITVTLPISAPRWARGVAANQNSNNGIMAGLYAGSDGKQYAVYNESSVFMYAMAAAEAYLPDLSAFDRNHDGFVSPTEAAFLVVYSGGEAAGMGTDSILGKPGVWAHSGTAHNGRRDGGSWDYLAVKLGSVLVYKYTIMGEAVAGTMNPGQTPAWTDPVQIQFGTACHELGHDLGLADLYDTAYSGMTAQVSGLSLMSGGNWGRATLNAQSGSSPTHLDAFSKAYLGFAEPPVISEDGVYTLSAPESADGYNVCRVDTPDPDIYYLLENRRYLGFDRGLYTNYIDIDVHDGGIVIWRIDKNAISKYWDSNTVNNNDGEFGVMPVFHDGNYGLPFYGGYDFTDGTKTARLVLADTNIRLSFFAKSADSMDVAIELSHIIEPPVIITQTLPNGSLGKAYRVTLMADSDRPVVWRLSQGRLPDGIALSEGQLYGIAAAEGTFTFSLCADNGIEPAAVCTYTIVISGKQAPVITTEALEMGYLGENYYAELGCEGAPPITWRMVGGRLPKGLSLSADGAISGDPEAAETTSFTVRASNGIQPDAERTLSITIEAIDGEPCITTEGLPMAYVGIPYRARIMATGTAPIRLTLTAGALPDGLTLTDGVISGTPVKAEETDFTITASNGIGEDDVQELYLYVDAAPTPPSILTDELDDGLLGGAYYQELEASGGGRYQWRVAGGRLPNGVALTQDVLTGTPLETGAFTVTLAVSNGIAPDAEKTFTFAVTSALTAPVIVDEALPVGEMGEPYDYTLTATGGGTMQWQLAGTLPGGLSFMDGGFSGIPSKQGIFPITVIARNGVGPDAVKRYQLKVCMYTCGMEVLISPKGAGTVTGAGSYCNNDMVTLTATANPGYRFVRWIDTDNENYDLLEEFSRENPLTFEITYDMAMTAEFARTVTITAQPTDCHVLEGERAAFSVSAVGEKLRYQWSVDRLDGRGWQTIKGAASAEYRTAAVALAQDGYRYRCTITDADGNTAQSEPAVLHVTAIPPVTGDRGVPMLWLIVMVGCVMVGYAIVRRRKCE